MTNALWLLPSSSFLAPSEIAILASIFCTGLVSTADERKSLISCPINVVLGQVGLMVRAYDHDAYSAVYRFSPAVHLIEYHRQVARSVPAEWNTDLTGTNYVS